MKLQKNEDQPRDENGRFSPSGSSERQVNSVGGNAKEWRTKVQENHPNAKFTRSGAHEYATAEYKTIGGSTQERQVGHYNHSSNMGSHMEVSKVYTGDNKMRLYGSISKVEEQEDGTLIVQGYASSEATDADGEVVKGDAMKAALPEFFKYGGTGPLREMHQNIAAGVVEAAEVQSDNRTFISARVVDPVSVKKVQAGVLKGFSIGGKKLPGGYDPVNKVISKLRLTEISLVDRPNNPEAVITFWKGEDMKPEETAAAAAAHEEKKPEEVAKTEQPEGEKKPEEVAKTEAPAPEHKVEITKAEEQAVDELAKMLNERTISPERLVELAKRDFSEKEREKAADKGQAMPDGSFPIKSAKDVENAVKLVGKAKDPEAAKKHIIERAKAIGATDELPADWPGSTKKDKSEKAEDAGDIKKSIYTAAQALTLLDQLKQLADSTEFEREQEGDDSKVPDELKQLCQAFGDVIKDMVAEEVDELTDYEEEDGMVAMATPVGDITKIVLVPKSYKAKVTLSKSLLSAKPEELEGILKAAGAKIAKAGARHSKADADRLQAIHDHAVGMGAACPGTEKSEGAALKKIEEGGDLQKRLTETEGALATALETNKKLDERIAKLEAQPMPAKATLKFVTIEKAQDVGSSEKEKKEEEVEPVRKADGTVDEAATAIKKVHQSGGIPVIRV